MLRRFGLGRIILMPSWAASSCTFRVVSPKPAMRAASFTAISRYPYTFFNVGKPTMMRRGLRTALLSKGERVDHWISQRARRALRALKGLVRLQALVRGHIVRKFYADRLQRLQAILRAQARARAGGTQISELLHSRTKSSQFHQSGSATPEKFEHPIRPKSTKHDQLSILRRNSSRSNGTTDDEKNDRVLEIDTVKPYIVPKRINLIYSTHLALASDQYSHSFTTSKASTSHQTLPSPSSCEVQSFSPLKLSREVEEDSFCTANSSPQFYSASSWGATSKRSPFTSTKRDGSKSYLSGYSDYPNYMACTESSKAKLRSLSAPKQRPHYDRSSSTKRHSIHGFGESISSTQWTSALHANFANKASPESGRLDKHGMPVGYRY